MKPYQDQNHYELLEVEPSASEEEIRQAVERAQAMFAEDSLAVYTLVDPGEADALRGRIQRAAQTLLNVESREDYDRSLGIAPRPRTPAVPAPAPVPEAPAPLAAVVQAAPAALPVEAPAPPSEPVYELSPPSAMTLAPRAAPLSVAEPPQMTVPTKLASVRAKGMEIPPDAEFNGELLRQVRESRGQSVAQIADRTRIGKMHLENVEADRYEALPAAVYLRGILMNLARELQLDPLRVAKSYLTLVQNRRKPS